MLAMPTRMKTPGSVFMSQQGGHRRRRRPMKVTLSRTCHDRNWGSVVYCQYFGGVTK
jgi:hypothetical protein